MEAEMDNSQSDFQLAPPPPPQPPVEQPQEAEISGDGESEGCEVMMSKVQKLMDMITSSQDNPNPKALHALASILESQESKYMDQYGHASPSNARCSHNIGRLANLVMENDDFFELLSSKFLLETKYPVAVQAAASRVLLRCSPTWKNPYVFEKDVLENVKNWVMDSSALADDNDGWKTKNLFSDLEMRRAYSTGLLAVCLSSAGKLLEDVLTSGISAKLMHYLRIRVLGETSLSQNSHVMEKSRSVNTAGSRGKDEGRSRIRQSLDTALLNDSRILEDDTSLDQYPLRNHDRNVGQQPYKDEGWLNGELHDGMALGVDDYEPDDIEGLQHCGDVHDVTETLLRRSFHNEDDASITDDLLRRRVTLGLSRFRERDRARGGILETEQHLVSPGSGSRLRQFHGNMEKSSIDFLDGKLVADAKTSTNPTIADGCAVEDDNDTCFKEYKVGSKDISALVRSAVRAAEAEAKAANAPLEAVQAAGEAAAELVKSAAVDEFKTTNDEDAACLAASRAACTVVDAAVAIEVSRNLIAGGAGISMPSDANMESVKDIVDITIPDSDFLAQQREMYCIRCLVSLGEYIEVLGPVLQEKGVDVCIGLLQRYSELQDEDGVILLPDVLKLFCALAAHRKFAALFVDRGGMQKLLNVPRVSYTFFGLSSCLFAVGSLQGVMEHVCTLPSNIVHQMVELGLQLLECSQDQARKNAALFFASVFIFRAILDAFDALDGLQKLLSLLREAASVRSGVNSATLTPSASGSLRNDRSSAEVLTSSEKQIAYHTCIALRQYFRAQLLLLVDFIRPNKSSRGAARNIPSVRAAHKPLDISNEAMDAVLLQIQKDRKLGPALVRARWSAVDNFLAFSGHITMLELCQAPPVDRYLRDLLQYALGLLQIVTLVHYSRKLVITASLSNNRVGIAIILDAANGSGYSDPEIIKQALNVLVNLVCPPPSISNKPPLIVQSQQTTLVQSSSGPFVEIRGRNKERDATNHAASMPNQSEPLERSGEAVQTPASSVASGLVGDRRISLGAGAGCAGLAAQLEQGYCQARDAVRSNSGIKILLQLIPTHTITSDMLDCVRVLACRVLLGLARDETIAHILTKLQVGKKLSEIIRDLSCQMPGTVQSRWKTELTQVSLELIAIVTNSGRASTLAATDAATPTLRRIERAAIAAATPITYHSRELLLLIYEHLQARGLSMSAAALLKEAHFRPLPSLVAPMFLAHHIDAQDSPRAQFQWPSGRIPGGFPGNKTKSMARHDSLKIKPLVLSSSHSSSKNQNLSSDLQTPCSRKVYGTSGTSFGSTSKAGTPLSSSGESVGQAETKAKTPVVLSIKRKATQLKEIFSASAKRLNKSDQGLHSPVPLTPTNPVFGLKNSRGTPQAESLDDAAQHCQTPLASGGADRLTLDSMVVQYLKHQHRQCPAPITTLPPLSLLHPHVCPEPKRSVDAPLNLTARLGSREYRSMYGGIHGNRRDRQFIYSRYRPLRTCRDDSNLQTSMAFLKDSLLAIGFHTGELKIFDTYHNNVVETCGSHQSPVTLVQSYFSGNDRLILSSSTSDVRLWNASSISGGPIHSFNDCKTAKFSNSGTVFAALTLDSSQPEILLYDIRTYQLDQKFSGPAPSTSGLGHPSSLIHFSPLDTMLLWNGVLWDRRVPHDIHKFDQFTDFGGGGFHPSGNELIINSEVWDLRKFRLLRSVPSLDQTTIEFNTQGDVIYAILRRNLDDVMSVVHARRAKHPLYASFRTLDAINYSDIATVPVDRCVLNFSKEPTDSVIGLITLDEPTDMISSARIYEVGRRKPTDYDSDPEDADESDEDDYFNARDHILGPILAGDDDSADSGSDVEDIVNDGGLNGGGGIVDIVTEGEEDDDGEDSIVESYSSEDDDYFEEDLIAAIQASREM